MFSIVFSLGIVEKVTVNEAVLGRISEVDWRFLLISDEAPPLTE